MEQLKYLYNKTTNSVFIRAIRGGLVMSIPVLMIGSFALILRSIPIPEYQTWINTFLNGAVFNILSFISYATFGILSLYMTFFISLSYAKNKTQSGSPLYGAPITAIGCFIVLCGMYTEGFALDTLGAKGMFTAIISAMAGSGLYFLLYNKIRTPKTSYADGSDPDFNLAYSIILPVAITVGIFAIVNYVITVTFNVSGFHELFINFVNQLFANIGRSFASSLLYIFTTSVLWFFGIHGSNVLESVSQSLFVQGMDVNIANVSAGLPPTEIFTKTFLDSFVVMGGCGATLCLLFAILIFSKRRSSRKLASSAAFPMIFNINEMMVFGLPIVFNPSILIPFLLVPILTLCTSTLAVTLGWVPIAATQVEWTTPIILSGYLATGSISGAILQIVNLVLGILIYRPFIKLYDNQKNQQYLKNLDSLTETLKQIEKNGDHTNITTLPNQEGEVAKMLAVDLQYALEHNMLMLYYQPQYNHENKCIGAEALLRWEHGTCGMIYPPLIIKIAEESRILKQLEQYIIKKAAGDLPKFIRKYGTDFKVCVNITMKTLQSQGFEEYLKKITDDSNIKPQNLCLEVTEQMAVFFNPQTEELLQQIRAMGFSFAIDDFSMGYTSLKYLQSKHFDMVKLDGSLIFNMQENPRSKEIIMSIIQLSQSLDFSVLSEFVETEQQRDALQDMGCYLYQGYLFGRAMPLSEWELTKEVKQY